MYQGFYRKRIQKIRISVNTVYKEIDFAGAQCYIFGFPNLHIIFFPFHSEYFRLIFIQISFKKYFKPFTIKWI